MRNIGARIYSGEPPWFTPSRMSLSAADCTGSAAFQVATRGIQMIRTACCLGSLLGLTIQPTTLPPPLYTPLRYHTLSSLRTPIQPH